MNSSNSISLIIATLNRGEDIVALLRQIKTFNYKPTEIIIIDQSENYTNDIKIRLDELVSKKELNINYKKTEIKSASYARNFGVSLATFEYIIFIDDDVILPDDFFESYNNIINGCQSFDAIAGIVVDLDEKINYSLPKEFNDKYFGYMFRPMNYGYPLKNSDLGTCNMLIKKSVFTKLNGFDTNLKRLEDSDFAYRFLNNGYLSYYDPSINVIHKFTPTGASRHITSNKKKPFPSKEYWQQYFYFVLKNASLIKGKTLLCSYLKPVFFKKGLILRPLRFFPAIGNVFYGYFSAKKTLKKL